MPDFPPALTQALVDWPLWGVSQQPPRAEQITALPQGFTNHGYLLELPAGQFVLRLNAANSTQLGIDRASEIRIQQFLAQQQLAPEVIYHAPGYRYWLREYVPGKVLRREDLTLATVLDMAAYLQHIHCLPPPAGIAMINVEQSIQAYQKQLGHKPVTVKAISPTGGEFLPRLCHMDPTAANWIRQADGQLCLLDWEYAGLGNPIWDIATLALQAQFSPPDEAIFLQQLGLSNDTAWQRAKRQMQTLSTLWFEVQN